VISDNVILIKVILEEREREKGEEVLHFVRIIG